MFLFSPEDIFSLLLERERNGDRGREREKHWCEKHWMVAFLYALPLGTEPATWVCALTVNWTRDLLVHGTVLHPTEPHWPRQEVTVLFETVVEAEETEVHASFSWEANGLKHQFYSEITSTRQKAAPDIKGAEIKLAGQRREWLLWVEPVDSQPRSWHCMSHPARVRISAPPLDRWCDRGQVLVPSLTIFSSVKCGSKQYLSNRATSRIDWDCTRKVCVT